jgi:hypothetical protein
MFRIPESRAEFLRGWDHDRGVDKGRAVGSVQADELRAHTHKTSRMQAFGNVSGAMPTAVVIDNGNMPTFSDFAGGIMPAGGEETRPRNLAVMWCIKAWNAPVNQGDIDIAALAALAQQASEIKLGMAKVASQAQTDAGTDDATIVTPKKLRWGFSCLLGYRGFVAFPTWLGGFIIQWGQVTGPGGTDISVNYPIAFAYSSLITVGSLEYTRGQTLNGFVNFSIVNRFSFQARHNFPGNTVFHWISLGS